MRSTVSGTLTDGTYADLPSSAMINMGCHGQLDANGNLYSAGLSSSFNGVVVMRPLSPGLAQVIADDGAATFGTYGLSIGSYSPPLLTGP